MTGNSGGTEPLSAAKRELIGIVLALPPERLSVVVRLLRRVDDGMPIDEAKELFWREVEAEVHGIAAAAE